MKTEKKTPFERLTKAANKFGGDKQSHGYLAPYAAYLPEKCQALLEIGVAEGASAQMWCDYFGLDCDIHLIDIFLNPDFVSPPWCRRKNFIPHQGDQSDLEFLKTIRTQFDVIIDDGSHRADHMLISFMHLFSNNLRSKGLYVIEDLATCKEEFYRGNGLCETYEDTALWMLKNYERTGNIENVYVYNSAARAHFEAIIEKVVVVNDKIAFIWKK